MNFDIETVNKLKSFARGERTWAEVQGMTYEEAKEIAELGCELAAAGRLEEARVLFEGLIEGNPKDSAARSALGTVYQKLDRLEDALEQYSAALQHDAANPVALANRGELLLRRGERQGLVDLTEAVKADPDGETTAGRRAKLILQAITQAAAEADQQSRNEK